MIKVENIETWGFDHAIRGMRNPLNSWDKSDSDYGCGNFKCWECEALDDSECYDIYRNYVIGNADMALMQKLYKAGSEHRKYLRQIFVSMDITAPLYWWKEFDTYKVGTVANSCSTMHKIHSKEFTLDDFSHEKMSPAGLATIETVINRLNIARKYFIKKVDNADMGLNYKTYWWDMIQLLPSSYNQRRTVTMNYENAVNMIRQRENHKLDEWRDFVKELQQLPYIKQIMEGDSNC